MVTRTSRVARKPRSLVENEKKKSPNDSSHLTEEQQTGLCRSFSHGWAANRLAFRFQVKCFQSSIVAKLKTGWRTRPVYSGDMLAMDGNPHTTKRHGVVFLFKFVGDTLPEWTVKDGFELAELTYDKCVELFGSDFEDLVTEAMGETWASAIARMSDAMLTPEVIAVAPAEPRYLCVPEEAW